MAAKPTSEDNHSAKAQLPAHPTEVPKIARDRYDLRLFQSLRRILRAVDIHSRKLRQVAQLTSPQLMCLTMVIEEGPLTATDLARRMHLSAATVVGILDRLEKRELLTRLRDRTDRRRVNISATTTGEQLVRRAPTPLQGILAEALAELPKARQAQIARGFEIVVEILEADHLAAEPVVEAGSLVVDPPTVLPSQSKPR